MEKLLNFIRKLILYIWLGLTIIITMILIIKIINPDIKGISNYDLKMYAGISIIFFVIYFLLKLLKPKNKMKVNKKRRVNQKKI